MTSKTHPMVQSITATFQQYHLRRLISQANEVTNTAGYVLQYQERRRRLVFNLLLTSSSTKMVRCRQQVLLSIKIRYLHLVEFMYESKIIFYRTVISVALKLGLLCMLQQQEQNPSCNMSRLPYISTFIYTFRNVACIGCTFVTPQYPSHCCYS
jgi:hypothetical protein